MFRYFIVVINSIVGQKLSVREVESMIKSMKNSPKETSLKVETISFDFDSVKNRLDRVKLDGSKKVQHVLSSINLDQNLSADDFAFNPKDKKIYFIDYNDGWFKRIDIVGNNGYVKKVKEVGKAWTIIAVFDVDGNFYYNRGYEVINKLAIKYNSNTMDVDSITVINEFSKINKVTQGDGARCANAPMDDEPTPQTPFSCKASGTVVSYVTSGSASNGDSNVALISMLDGGILSDNKLPSPTIGVVAITVPTLLDRIATEEGFTLCQ